MGRAFASDVLLQYQFRVEIDGQVVGKFTEVTGLATEYEEGRLNEGGRDTPYKIPGRPIPEDVTLRRGILTSTGDPMYNKLWQLYQNSRRAVGARSTIIIQMTDREGTPVGTGWVLREAWVKRWEGPELNALSSDPAVEAVVIACEEIEPLR